MRNILLGVLLLVTCTVYAAEATKITWTPATTDTDGLPLVNHEGSELWCKNTAKYNKANVYTITDPLANQLLISDWQTKILLTGYVTCVMKTVADGKKSANSNEVIFYMSDGVATIPNPTALPSSTTLSLN